MPTLQLKYGDLILEVVEAWSESLDWPVEAETVPGSWAGIAFARRPAPSRITLTGFIASQESDPTAQHRADYGALLRQVNNTVEDSKRSSDAAWELWHFDDRFIKCRPLSFTYEHIDGLPWASRFTMQLIAPDPRWYSASTSNCVQWGNYVAGSNYLSMGTSLPGDAPCEPWFDLFASECTSVAVVNRFKNVLKNGNLRDDAIPAGAGVPPAWRQVHVSGDYTYAIRQFDEDFGRAWVNITQSIGATTNGWYQDVLLTEPGTAWTFSSSVVIPVMEANSEAYLRLHYFGAGNVSLDVTDSTPVIGPQYDYEGTWTVTTPAGGCPNGTQMVRAIIYVRSTDAVNGSFIRFSWKWAQLERGEVASDFEYKEPERLEFVHPGAGYGTSMNMRLDARFATAEYVYQGTGGFGGSNILSNISDGNFWSLDPGPNELLFEWGLPSGVSQTVDVKWRDAWWGK